MKVTKKELSRVQSKAKVRVADIPLRLKPAPNVRYLARWLDELDMWQSAYWNNDPLRPGASSLTQLQTMIVEVRKAIDAGDAKQAAWAGMRAMHAAWLAQYLDSENILQHGRTAGKQHRKNLSGSNAESEAAANARVEKAFNAWRHPLYGRQCALPIEAIAGRYHKARKKEGDPVTSRDNRRLYDLIRQGNIG